MDNKHIAVSPLTINLPDSKKIQSTHVCDINIQGLPTTLTGHIVPLLMIISLIGIRPLCNAGCKVIFDNKKCNVIFNGKVILRGFKDPSTDLWTLPIPNGTVGTTPGEYILPRPGPCEDCAPHRPALTPNYHPGINLSNFMHSVRTQANTVTFAHQSLCNPKISTLLKATRKGFLKGCPNMTKKLITKYLNASPGTAKGHMKRPQHGIKSTRPKPPTARLQPVPTMPTAPSQPAAQIKPPVLPILNEGSVYPDPAYGMTSRPNLIGSDKDKSIANIFCFGAFVDKNNGIVYHDLMGLFPFMSYNGSICFFILYHYESNSILAMPITGLKDVSIYKAYKQQFELLTSKGFKPKLNIMDSQATKHIKTFLTKNDCKLQLVELHNHRVNTAERAIQTFKDAFIAAVATTYSNFSLQLWDRLTLQIQGTLNLLRASRIDPTKSAYEILNGSYNWNQYPLAPIGCKAIVYEYGNTRGSWALQGVDAWYLGPSKDHYH